ncbi:MAG: family 43 glycosylhydrolase, partial [Polyangiaceae bacterium]
MGGLIVIVLACGGCGDDGVDAASPEAGTADAQPGGEGRDAGTQGGLAPGDAGLGAQDAAADAAAAPLPSPVPYANPVLAADFPDPTVIRGADKKLYAFATGGLIQRASSPDLVHWKVMSNAMATKPSWASTKNNFWAPHVVAHGGTYYLYFSAEQNAGTGSFCIGVATATGPDQPFVDVGAPIVCGASFVNIDP